MVALVALVPGKTVFKMGSSGPAVRQFQLALAKLGYPLNGTGFFGTSTDTAVESFQRLHKVEPVDGVIGTVTARALDEALSLLSTGAMPESVTKFVGRPLWLQAGLKLVGTKEFAGKSNNPVIIDWAKDIGGDIEKAYTADVIPWCALFANYCLSLADLKGTGTLWALDFAGKWPSIKLSGPAVGAFAPMLRDGGGHIIQIVGKDQHGNIMGLGGNQSDAVNIKPFALSRLNKGFWWPSSVVPLPATGMSSLPLVSSDGRVSSKES